jgi:hypothetical protein
MINNNLKFMKSKEIRPYEFYFLDEDLFRELISTLKSSKGGDYKISTIGFVREYDSTNNESVLVHDNVSIKLNTSRISNFFKYNTNNYYIIYGILKVIIFIILV